MFIFSYLGKYEPNKNIHLRYKMSGIQSLKQLISGNTSALAAASTFIGGELSRVEGLATGEETRALIIEGPLRSELDAEVLRATVADADLRNDVIAAASAILTNKGTASDDLAQEVSDRQAAVLAEHDARVLALAQEVSDRDAAIAAESLVTANAVAQEVTDRTAAVSAESDARVLGLSKTCFSHVLEFEGILEDGAYPMSAGYGSVSAPGFGVSMPFAYRLVGWSLICKSVDVSAYAEVVLEHYALGDSVAPTVLDASSYDGNVGFISRKVTSGVMPPGSVCIRVGAVGNLVDVGAAYRISLYLQADDAF